MVISHNLMAMNAMRQYGINAKSKASTTEKLSSGYKINRAADGAAELAISEKMRRKIRGLTQGVQNTQDGVSMCQVADGALSEVDEMLHRITELSVKAANGTNTLEDRAYIQDEVGKLLEEIDRIGDTTTFNELPLFKGSEKILRNADGTVGSWETVGFDDIKFADVSLAGQPMNGTSSINYLNFAAVVDKAGHAMNGVSIPAIYGGGSTSAVKARIYYTDDNGVDVKQEIDLSQITPTNFKAEKDAYSRDVYSKEFKYSDGTVDLTFRQEVKCRPDDKRYSVAYYLNNESDREITCDLMIHMDTAYDNNDYCEEYYRGGNKITETGVFAPRALEDLSPFYGDPGLQIINADSAISVINADDALPYSERFYSGFGTISIGQYSEIREWSYYDNIAGNSGKSTENMDLGIAYISRTTFLPGEDDSIDTFSFSLKDARNDDNLVGVPINFKTGVTSTHIAENPIWIHSGNEPGDGIDVIIKEMNTNVLGIRDLNVSTKEGAEEAIKRTNNALASIADNRSTIGAQQNRLEHTINNENNIVENTTAAESAIRDTDMAKEFVRLSTQSILEQVGVSMMTQANQTAQGVLTLLQ